MAGAAGMGAGMFDAAGDLTAMWAANEALDNGYDRYQNEQQKGINTLQQGQAGANTAFSPYSAAGTSGIGAANTDIMGRQQSANPNLTNTSPNAVSSYINPSAAYSTDQARKASEASAAATGGMGGGMQRALSNNANKMGMTNYNNAYQQMIDTNNQNFGQQQQLYKNNTDYQQQQIQNKMGLGQLGLSATTANQGLQGQYNSGISNMYGDWAKTGNELGQNKSGLFYNGIGSATHDMSAGVGSFAGGLG